MQLLGESEARIFDLMLKAVGAAIAAAWVFYIYSAERAKDRDIHRQIEEQSYVIPFMRSSEDLRSRLYNVINSNGLSSLNNQYPDKVYAEEILYLFAQYFGWHAVVERHSTYGRDSKVISFVDNIHGAMADDVCANSLPSLQLFRVQQHSLGQMAVIRNGAVFDVASFNDFIAKISQDFPGRDPIQKFLDVFREAKTVDKLGEDGQCRLKKVEMFLFCLVEYLQKNEDIRLVPVAYSQRDQTACHFDEKL